MKKEFYFGQIVNFDLYNTKLPCSIQGIKQNIQHDLIAYHLKAIDTLCSSPYSNFEAEFAPQYIWESKYHIRQADLMTASRLKPEDDFYRFACVDDTMHYVKTDNLELFDRIDGCYGLSWLQLDRYFYKTHQHEKINYYLPR